MLKRLTLHNYALVEKIDIDFGPGLTVLTGETGAGKSVIIGGLMLALGARADRDFIRHGADKTTAAAVFDISAPDFAKRLSLVENILPPGKDISMSREISASGSSKNRLNDSPVTLAVIKDIAAVLIDYHSQQGTKSLLDVDQHLALLDSFAGLIGQVEKLAALYADYTALEKQIHQAKANASAMREKLELINFQIDELTKADIRPGEEDELEAERRRLESVRTLAETGQAIVSAISESDNSVSSVLSQLEKQLAQAARIDKQLDADSALLSESVINLNELVRNIESYLSRLEDDPARLDEINERQAELFRLRKKYDTDEAGLLAKLDDLQNQSYGAADYDALIRQLTDKLARARKDYFQLATDISTARKNDAVRLEKKIKKELDDLAIAKARFKIDFQVEHDEHGFKIDGDTVAAYPHGLENIEFLISTNPNEPLKPLVKIASGGEISRIMLALMTVIAGKYHLPTIIFDEIDTGIGGETAVKLAQKLKQLSTRHQVITISHLPAVASQADHHLAVYKSLKDGRNIISVTEVTGRALKEELARMTGKS